MMTDDLYTCTVRLYYLLVLNLQFPLDEEQLSDIKALARPSGGFESKIFWGCFLRCVV